MTYRLYRNVEIGAGAQIGDYVIIGLPPKGRADGELRTIIGADAIVRSHSVIYAGNVIGDHFATGHGAMIRECNRIGSNVSVGTHSVVEHHVEIHDHVRIHSQVFVPEYSVLEEGAWLGPNVVLTNTHHPLCPKAKECMKGPVVGRHAKICANATVLPDLTIGESALVGANAVVTRDVPPRTVVAGVPATVIKSIDDLDCPYHLIDRPYPPR